MIVRKNAAVITEEFPLSGLPVGGAGKITRIASSELKIALMGLGFSEGDEIELTDRAPFHGPLAIKANGIKVALRESDAAQIWLVNIDEG